MQKMSYYHAGFELMNYQSSITFLWSVRPVPPMWQRCDNAKSLPHKSVWNVISHTISFNHKLCIISDFIYDLPLKASTNLIHFVFQVSVTTISTTDNSNNWQEQQLTRATTDNSNYWQQQQLTTAATYNGEETRWMKHGCSITTKKVVKLSTRTEDKYELTCWNVHIAVSGINIFGRTLENLDFYLTWYNKGILK